ncbi:MAG TPA: TetR family transcriptional regulator [Aliidongia sp.]|nr:TetR family transcriptional regulator [Aliidongia sp.]
MTERVRAESVSAREASSDVEDGDAILRSALILFSQLDYDQVTLRMVACKSGLSDGAPAYHFGSKEQLFAAAVDVALARIISSADGIAALGRNGVAVAPLGMPMKDADDPAALILRGAANARIMPILRSAIERHFERPSVGGLKGADGDQRAALLFAVLIGSQLASKIMDDGVSSARDPAIVSRHLDPLLQMLIDPPQPDEAKR